MRLPAARPVLQLWLLPDCLYATISRRTSEVQHVSLVQWAGAQGTRSLAEQHGWVNILTLAGRSGPYTGTVLPKPAFVK